MRNATIRGALLLVVLSVSTTAFVPIVQKSNGLPTNTALFSTRTDRDLYEVLGINRNATPREIKSAYRRLAKQYVYTPRQASEQGAVGAGFTDDRQKMNPPLASVYANIIKKVGKLSTRDPSLFATRQDMGIDDSYPLHIDLGGEGHFRAYGITSGFVNAINVNARENDSQRHKPIPMLVHVIEWIKDPPIPLADGTVNYITMQGAPLTEKNLSEIERVLAPGGRVGLWIALEVPVTPDGKTNQEQAERLASLLESKVQYNCTDEFGGEYSFAKICIIDGRNPHKEL